jgi:hypothetical protein
MEGTAADSKVNVTIAGVGCCVEEARRNKAADDITNLINSGCDLSATPAAPTPSAPTPSALTPSARTPSTPT